LLWEIRQDYKTTLVIYDYADYLDEGKAIHEAFQESIDIEYQTLRNGEISH